MLLEVEYSPLKQAKNNSKDSPKSIKRRYSIIEKDNAVSKKLCKDSISFNDSEKEHTEERSDEVHKDITKQSFKFNDHKCNLPCNLIELMYQLDLSVLCLFRKFKCEYKYRSLTLTFGDTEMNKFNDIIISYEKKIIHVQIENVDKYYLDNDITYAKLFAKEKHRFSINNYFNSFFEQVIYKPDLLNSIEYLVVYTNALLDITRRNELNKARSKQFYPYKFHKLNMQACIILKDFLLTSEEHSFYQFSREEVNREELLDRLQFSPAMMKIVNERKVEPVFVRNMKAAFIDKLVFAVGQPDRYELNRIVRNEIKDDSRFEDDYITLQEKVLHALTASEKSRFGNYIAGMMYEFHVLMSFLHTMFLHKHMSSINFETKNSHVSNNIIINYNDRITRLEVHNTDTNISYSQLFPVAKHRNRIRFSVNKYFTFFTEELNDDVRYFVIYTNTSLDLTEDKELKKAHSKDFHPLKFDEIDVEKKKYKVLRNCSSINKSGLYQFSSEETTKEKLMDLLELPSYLQIGKEEFSSEYERETKEKFLHKLIFAVNQPNRIALTTTFKEEIEKSNESNYAPYKYEELQEITLRWLEFRKSGPITKEVMKVLLEDIRNNRNSSLKLPYTNIDEEIKFAKRVAGNEGTPAFNKFLHFLIDGEGKTYLRVIKENGIALNNVFGIFSGSKANAIRAFKELYDLWFDKEGNKTRYMKILEEDEAKCLRNMYRILYGAGQSAADSFKNLFNLWFDEEGNKTRYLTTLEKEGKSVSIMSSILSGTRIRAAKIFKDLYDLWFDEKGNKTQYLRNLEKEGMSLSIVCSTLEKAKANAPKAFIDFYNLLFDKEGNKTQYLRMLQKEGIHLLQISKLLIGAKADATKNFKNLYGLFFDEEGNKTKCLETLEKEGIGLFIIFNISSKATTGAVDMFKTLYDLWFDAAGNKTRYVETLEKNGVRLFNISNILLGEGSIQVDIDFQNLYNLWFDEKGNKTQYLETFEREGIALSDICNILDGTGCNALRVFRKLYDAWFDAQGNRKKHFDNFLRKEDEEKSFTALNLLNILNGAKMKVDGAFENLHNVCFNDEGQKTELLDDFYKAGFKTSYLSCLLYKSGIYASHCLRRLHIVCFDEKREKTKLLNDFCQAGFKPRDLCNILSGAPQNIEKFHDFCFVGKTNMCLRHFLDNKDSFTIRNLCSIFYGTRIDICAAFEDFHDVCFDATGNKTKILNDFHQTGFTSKYLSNILFMSGSNAASVLKDFHKLCFGEKNYLSHFLIEAELFTPKNLSKILHGVESNIRPVFEKLHDMCFDKTGKKTKYLKKLIKNNRDDVFNILHEEVRSRPIV